MAAGRKGKYETHVKPRLKEIEEWKKVGATDEQIATQLGIGISTFYDYQKQYKEFSDTIKYATTNLILEIRGELAAMCKKRKLQTVKKYIKKDLETGKKTEYTEVTEKELDPNLGAVVVLLKNIDRENFKNDWDNYEFKKLEMELKQKMADKQLW